MHRSRVTEHPGSALASKMFPLVDSETLEPPHGDTLLRSRLRDYKWPSTLLQQEVAVHLNDALVPCWSAEKVPSLVGGSPDPSVTGDLPPGGPAVPLPGQTGPSRIRIRSPA